MRYFCILIFLCFDSKKPVGWGGGGVDFFYLYDALSAAICSLTSVSKYTVFIYGGLGEHFLAVNSEYNQTRLSHNYYNLPVDGFNIPST